MRIARRIVENRDTIMRHVLTSFYSAHEFIKFHQIFYCERFVFSKIEFSPSSPTFDLLLACFQAWASDISSQLSVQPNSKRVCVNHWTSWTSNYTTKIIKKIKKIYELKKIKVFLFVRTLITAHCELNENWMQAYCLNCLMPQHSG